MTESLLHLHLVWASLSLSIVVFITLLFIQAPYGKFSRQGWGPEVPNRLGWVLMEAPSAVLFPLFYVLGSAPKNLPLFLFLCLWEIHYLYRAFIYPFLTRNQQKKMPLSVIGLGLFFNGINTYLNGRYLFSFSGGYPAGWVQDPRFLGGVLLFITGLTINRWADFTLRKLRKPGQTGYSIPTGGLYNLVSCPNYLGEVIEWLGWAIVTWSLPGLAFSAWTFANLAPRARSHHTWYQKEFPDYPPDRKALFPGIW